MQPYPTRSELSTAALAYADAGWNVFPIWPIADNGDCSCNLVKCDNPGKHPYPTHGHNDASTNPDLIRRWWSKAPFGIGLATGAFTVIDFDLYHNEDAIHDFPFELPPTRVSLTGGGGEHYFYRTPPDISIRNKQPYLPGVDIRGAGGYVVLPPSPHVSGKLYEWEDAFQAFAELPPALAAELQYKREPIPNVITAYRNPTMAQLGGALRRVGCSPEQIYVMLAAFNKGFCMPPKSEREVERIANSIGRYATRADREAAALAKARELSDRFLQR